MPSKRKYFLFYQLFQLQLLITIRWFLFKLFHVPLKNVLYLACENSKEQGKLPKLYHFSARNNSVEQGKMPIYATQKYFLIKTI